MSSQICIVVTENVKKQPANADSVVLKFRNEFKLLYLSILGDISKTNIKFVKLPYQHLHCKVIFHFIEK